MKLSNLASLRIIGGVALFFAGVIAGKYGKPFENSNSQADHPPTDLIVSGSSAAIRKNGADASTERAATPQVSEDSVAQTALETAIRNAPYSHLKQLYLARQDEEFQRANERYSPSKDLDEKQQERVVRELFDAFQRGGGSNAHFYAEADWSLRGKKTVPVRLIAKFYSNRETPSFVPTELSQASEAGSAEELCWVLTAYFRPDAHYAVESTSTCLRWTSIREGAPYAILESNRKALLSSFDSISVPLPGFGAESTKGEWYDSVSKQWSPLPMIRWETKDLAEARRIEQDLQAQIQE